ncbi:hypothetical protein FRC07_005745 [Ceratobasidium sp. 392]|nr:hypothetical protein FRC07_005745 [Ceratobasidium sp. 392]
MTPVVPLTYVHTDNYFDSSRAEFVQGNHDIIIDTSTGLIINVQASNEQLPDGATEIDLRGLTVLPGFVDTHVHFFLHPYDEANWDDQTTRESLVERTIRAVAHARTTLLAGFTTVRDLGTEGAGDADIHLRNCISAPVSLIPGPRYFCASRAIVSTGSYGPKNKLYPSEQSVDGIAGAQVADGPDGCMRAVRQQIGAGVDWVKVYGDHWHRVNVAQTSPRAADKTTPLWTTSEWTSLVDTAHSIGVKVAVHSDTPAAALAALAAGVDSLEHGSEYDDQVISEIRAKRVTWSPTLSVFEDVFRDQWDPIQRVFKSALKENAKVLHDPDEGIRFACGSDIGAFAHGENARELKLMHSLGMPANCVLQAATLGGWRCVRGMEWEGKAGEERLIAQMKKPEAMGDNEVPFGQLARGFAADIIASSGRFGEDGDFGEAVGAKSIVFVMKAGKVCKKNGHSVIP